MLTGKTQFVGRFLSVVAMLWLAFAGGFYAHVDEVGMRDQVRSLSPHAHSDHDHSGVPDQHEGETGALHCGSNILALVKDCEISILASPSEVILPGSVAAVSHLAVPEPPPPRRS